MNVAISETSLYQLTQDLDEPLASISIGAETLKSHVDSIIDLVIEKQLRAKIWVKLPQTKSWLTQVQRLQKEGDIESIYLCSSQKNNPTLAFFESQDIKTPVIPVRFYKNSIIQRESFLIVIAENFCSLVLAQWQKGKIKMESSGKRLQQPYLEMVSSFDPQAIERVMLGIKPKISVTDKFVGNLDSAINFQTAVDPNLLGELSLKQVSHSEKIQTTLNSLSKTNYTPDKNYTVLGLQEDFLNNLVSELRSPITHMKTALSLLESKQIKGEQRQRYLKMVSDECDRQNSLVGGLLQLLQLDTPIETEHLYLDDFIPGIVSTYQPLAEEKEIQLGYTIPAGIPPISCPRIWLRQIIINLLNNSLQFTPPKGRVFVQATAKNDREYVEILFSDTGVGIPNGAINKIFDGFYRTKPTTQAEYMGAGLGLTLVKQLVQKCGGSISVTSKVGKGTTFKILMPAVPAELV